MDLAAMWQRVLRAIRQEPGVFSEIGSDEKATGEAIVVAIGASLLGGLGAVWPGGARFSGGSWITGALGAGTLGIAIVTGVYFLVAKLFKSQGTYVTLFRAVGYGSAPSALGIIPVVGTIVGAVWSIVLMIRAVRETQGVTSGAAAAVVLIPVAIGIVIALVVFFALAVALFGFAAGES